MLAELGRRGLAEVAARLQKSITTTSVWGAKAEAAPDDVLIDLETACRLASAVAFPNEGNSGTPNRP